MKQFYDVSIVVDCRVIARSQEEAKRIASDYWMDDVPLACFLKRETKVHVKLAKDVSEHVLDIDRVV
jgi:hypothetical protein